MTDPTVLSLISANQSGSIGEATRRESQARIDAMGPWFYDIDLQNGLCIRSKVSDTHGRIHDTRRAMVEAAVVSHFGARVSSIRAIDLGCHEGYFSFVLRGLGVSDVLGIDVRDENLARARTITELSGLDHVRFRSGNCERLDEVVEERFDLTLMLGLLYHQENPIGCLRQAASVCREMLVVETQVVDDVEGSIEWGRRECVHPYEGHFALVDESVYEENLETGATPLALCPSPRAIAKILEHLGFSRVRTLPVPADANEQFVRGRRIIVAASRNA